MSLLSHRASRGLANQLLVPLALAAALVLAVVGGVLTLDAREAAQDGRRDAGPRDRPGGVAAGGARAREAHARLGYDP